MLDLGVAGRVTARGLLFLERGGCEVYCGASPFEVSEGERAPGSAGADFNSNGA